MQQPTVPEAEATSPDQPENDEAILHSKFASEVGGRNSSRLTGLFDRAGGWFGLGKRDVAATNAQGNPNLPLPGAPRTRLGRGGWTAVAVLIVALPILAAALYWAINLNTEVQGYKSNLEKIRNGLNSGEREGDFVAIVTSPKVQVIDLQTTDAAPIGSMRLYAADYKQWALVYSGLVPTNQNNVYMAWVVRLPAGGGQPQPEDYFLLTAFVNQPGGRFLTLSEPNFPGPFAYANYSRLIITEEPGANGQPKQPTGPIRFALDLSKVKLY